MSPGISGTAQTPFTRGTAVLETRNYGRYFRAPAGADPQRIVDFCAGLNGLIQKLEESGREQPAAAPGLVQ